MKAGRDGPHRLMVVAVDRGRSADQRRETRGTTDFVTALAVSFDVLAKCAAKEYVDRLYSAADAEDRFAAGEERVEQRLFLFIADRVDG